MSPLLEMRGITIEGESVAKNIPVPVKLVTEENVSEFLQ